MKRLVVWYLNRELERIEHNIESLEINQDVIPEAQLFHNRYRDIKESLINIIEWLF